MAGKLNNCLEGNSLLALSQFSYRRGLETCDAMLTWTHPLQVVLDRGMEGRLVQFDFSAAFYMDSHCALLYKLISIDIGEQFLSIVSEFLSDRRQRSPLHGKVSASVDAVSREPQGSVLGLLFILCNCWLFYIVGNHIVAYANDTTISYTAVILRLLSRSQGMELLN